MRKISLTAASALLLAGAVPANAAIVHFSDFIDDASRTNFVSFDSATADTEYLEDGVRVSQKDNNPGDIWTGCGAACNLGTSGNIWYPNGGDNGWTEIAREGGSPFSAVGMLIGSGYGASVVEVVYELLLGERSVMLGRFETGGGYLGFSGGDFDTVRVGATLGQSLSFFGDGTFQAAAIDSIELAGDLAPVPVPAGLPLLLAGLGGFGLMSQRRKSQ